MDRAKQSRLGPTRAEVLDHLRELGAAVSAAAVADALGLHANTTRFHLDALAGRGLIVRELEQRSSPGRPRVLYRAVEGPARDHHRDLAAVMVRHFAGPLEGRAALARRAGHAWGTELRAELTRSDPDQPALQRLLTCLGRLGYAPRLEAGGELLVQRPCPFAEIAGRDPEVVCQLHLGLIRGVLGDDQPLRVPAIRPWATSTRCEVPLATAAVTGDAGA